MYQVNEYMAVLEEVLGENEQKYSERIKSQNLEDKVNRRVQYGEETNNSRTSATYQSTNRNKMINIFVLVFDVFGLLSIIL